MIAVAIDFTVGFPYSSNQQESEMLVSVQEKEEQARQRQISPGQSRHAAREDERRSR